MAAVASAIEIQDVTVGYHPGHAAVADLSLTVERGEFLGVIGPNGSGKTTLVRLIAGALVPARGRVLVDSRPVNEWPRRLLARHVAVVPQMAVPPFAFTVGEYVALGRNPYLAPWGGMRAEDAEAVSQALALTGLARMADRRVTELSGGELQRATLARALAQQSEILLLDEPTSFLDPAHSVRVLSLLEAFNGRGGTVLGVFHDLNLAGAYCKRILAMRAGRAFAVGDAQEIIGERVIQELFETPVAVDAGPDGRPRVTLLRASAAHVA